MSQFASALQPLVGLIASLALGAFVLHRRPGDRRHQIHSAMSFTVSGILFCDLMSRLAPDAEGFRFWIDIATALIFLGLSITCHFTLHFPTPKAVLEKEKYVERHRWLRFVPDFSFSWDRWLLARRPLLLFLLYLPALVIPLLLPYLRSAAIVVGSSPGAMSLVFSGASLPPATLAALGVGALLGFWLVFYLVSGGVTAYIRAESAIQRFQVKLLFLAVLVIMLPFALFTVILPNAGFPNPLAGIWWFAAGVPVITFSMVRAHLFVSPVSETLAPTTPRFDLKRGLCYLVKEEKPGHAFDIFADQVTHGGQGLCLTRTPPAVIREQYLLEKTPIVWVGEQAPSPEIQQADGTDEIAYLCAKFLKDSTDGIVVFDSLVYLIQNADFRKALKLLYHLKELVARKNARLLLSVNPDSLQQQELAILETEFENFAREPQKKIR